MAPADATSTALVKFHVRCSGTKPGQAVFICGSAAELGAWDAEGAVPCVTTPQLFPDWTSDGVAVPMQPSGGVLEFKVIMQSAKGSGKAVWESGPNRVLHLPRSTGGGQVQLVVECAWGVPEVSTQMKHARERGGSGYSPVAAADGQEGLSRQCSSGASSARKVSFGAAPTGTAPEDEPKDAVALSGAGEPEDLEDEDVLAPLGMPRQTSSTGMRRSCSRHLVTDELGLLNANMSRTPSMMLIDIAQLDQDCHDHEAELEQLQEQEKERQRLNVLQRRLNSGCLLEAMAEITNFADKSNIVLLQGFNWESWRAGSGDWYGVVESKVGILEEMGVTDIWLPPPSQSVAPQGYLPSRLFDLDGSKYGTQASLEGLITKLHQAGIRAVADIVVNHRCGDKQDSEGRWNQFSSGMTKRQSFVGVMDWGGWAITLGDQFSDGSGQNAPGAYDGKFDAAPDIDHRNKHVQDGISIWLRWLRLQVGFDAWRFDFVKGYSAEFVGQYCKRSNPAWAVGELWGDMAYDESGLKPNQDKHRQDLVNWINATDKESTAFDFTTKGVLQEAVRNCQYWRLRDSNGKPPGLIGWMPKHAVTFIDNHDTGSTQRHWPFPDDKVLVGYAYIVTHPGIPSIFWDHVVEWGEDHRRRISELLRARRESEIPVDAPVTIQCADADLYLAEVGSPPALRVALGPREAGAPDMKYWRDGPSGRGYHVWVKRMPEPQAAAPKSAPAVPAAKPAARPAAEPAAKPSAKQAPPPEAPGAAAFDPVNVDGTLLSQEVLDAMPASQLEPLCSRLEPVTEAARGALRRASGEL